MGLGIFFEDIERGDGLEFKALLTWIFDGNYGLKFETLLTVPTRPEGYR